MIFAKVNEEFYISVSLVNVNAMYSLGSGEALSYEVRNAADAVISSGELTEGAETGLYYVGITITAVGNYRVYIIPPAGFPRLTEDVEVSLTGYSPVAGDAFSLSMALVNNNNSMYSVDSGESVDYEVRNAADDSIVASGTLTESSEPGLYYDSVTLADAGLYRVYITPPSGFPALTADLRVYAEALTPGGTVIIVGDVEVEVDNVKDVDVEMSQEIDVTVEVT
jgi:hypothetical protein